MAAIYKPGQGYWTRVMSAVGVGVIVLTGVAWLWHELKYADVMSMPPIYVQSGMAVLVIAIAGGLTFWLLNKPNIADFMIATEGEMKKVNWPTRREIIGSTWVVIIGMVLFAVILFGVDVAFLWLFNKIGILQGG